MRIAAVVLACVLGSAAVAWAAEPARAIVEPAKSDALPANPSTPPASGPGAAQGAQPAVQPTPLKTPGQAAVPGPPRPRVDAARRPDAARARVCFSSSETREKIAAHRLAEPIKALRVGRQQGEALRARLCSWKTDKFFYEIFVLRRDGRIVHVYMNAANGQAVGALSESDLK